MNKRIYTLQIEIEAPYTTSDNEVSNAINAALEEPPCDWGEWCVGAARVVGVAIEKED